MGEFDENFTHTLKVQSWSLYGVGIFLVVLRIFARIKRLGILSLQADDYIMVFAACLYTVLVTSLNLITAGGGSNLYPPERTIASFTEEEIAERIYGSKIVVLSEQAMLNVIYAIKVCMLIMYTRLTLGLAVQRLVRYLAVYVAVGWIATQIAFFAACTPFSGYWAMPPPSPQCATLEHYALVQGPFNISSDLLMLLIPIPLALKMSMPWKQKLVLLFILSLGVFVIVAALLTKIFNLTNVYEPIYMLWYVREASVAVYVGNLPMIWPLLRDWFPCLRKLTPGGASSTSGYGRGVQAGSGGRLGGSGGKRGVSMQLSSVGRDGAVPKRAGGGRSGRESMGTLDLTYDVEMGYGISGQKRGGRGGGRAPSVDGGSSTEGIIPAIRDASTDGERGEVPAKKAGGIQVLVERTVVVHETAAREGNARAGASGGNGGEQGIYDWDHSGDVEIRTAVVSKR